LAKVSHHTHKHNACLV